LEVEMENKLAKVDIARTCFYFDGEFLH